jgi:photosystem II stability/assembly factor-like uncharacterized protein
MVAIRHVAPREGDVVLLVGTMKGAFVLRSNASRSKWETGGPYFAGQAIYALACDSRGGRHRLWAGGASDHWGPTLGSSDDFGRTWTTPEKSPIRFEESDGASVKRIWQIRPGRASEPGVLYAGVEPAALFETRDGGESWSVVRGLHDHPHRPTWEPGGGGLCLHTILPDPTNTDRMHVAISTGGVYRTDDGGRSWAPRTKGVRAEFMPDKYPEYGQCVHKIVSHPSRPERLFLQNHWGLYRSDDAGDSWVDIANGVPSDFGFAMAMHPHDPDTVYILPIESDMFRCTPEAKLRVYRTRNAGASWEPLTKGLPQQDALETVLRDCMDVDPLNPAGVYFGTRSGHVYGSADGGASWGTVLNGLPPIVCVKAYAIGDPAKARVSKPAKATKSRKPAAKRGAAKRGAAASKGAARRGARKTTAKRTPRKATPKRAPRKAAPKRAAKRK